MPYSSLLPTPEPQREPTKAVSQLLAALESRFRTPPTLVTSVRYAFIGQIDANLLLWRHRKAIRELANTADRSYFGPLMDIWILQKEADFPFRQRQVQTALIRVLQSLKPEDAPRVQEAYRAVLRNVLFTYNSTTNALGSNADLVAAITKAFGQIGDWKSAAEIQKLAEPANKRDIREAARECLPDLQRLAAKQKPGEMLLRASGLSAIAPAPDHLLRPAIETVDAHVDTLLRSSK